MPKAPSLPLFENVSALRAPLALEYSGPIARPANAASELVRMIALSLPGPPSGFSFGVLRGVDVDEAR